MKRPEDFTISELREFQQYTNKQPTIALWKIAVKEMATKYGLSDREAVDLARAELPRLNTSPK